MSDKQSKWSLMAKFNIAGGLIAIAAAGFFAVALFADPTVFTAFPDGALDYTNMIMLAIIFAIVVICREEGVAGQRDVTKEVAEEIARLKAELRAEWEKEKGGGD